MKSLSVISFFLACTLAVSCAESTSSAPSARPLDPEQIGQAAGTTANETADGVVRIAWARTDVVVQVDGAPLHPFAGLGSWAAFTSSEEGAFMMGDEVVFEDEVTPAMDAAFASGLEVTALHNHFFFDSPKVYFMHIGGNGDPVVLAAGVKAIWDAVRAVRAVSPEPAKRFPGGPPTPGELSAETLEQILGHPSQRRDGVLKFSMGRSGQVQGLEVGGSMGLATWAAFSGSDTWAAVDGDFIMTAEEVQPVLRALRRGGIHIVALHNHMLGGQPAYYFTHFWGKGPAAELAATLKAALDTQAEYEFLQTSR